MSLIASLSLGLLLTGCPSDDTGDEGAGTADDSGTATNPTTTTDTGPDGTTTDEPGTTTDGPGTTTDEPGTTTDEPGTTTDEPGTTTTEGGGVSFEVDVYPILEASCSCHVPGPSGMLAMPDAATAYANLVDVASANPANGQDRIEPGDPGASFLWNKVNDTLMADEGASMPLGLPQLDQADLDTIEQWILDGAQP